MGETRAAPPEPTHRRVGAGRRLRVRIRLLDRRRRRLSRAATVALRAASVRLAALSRRALRASVILGAIAAVAFSVGALAATFYGQFGYHPGRNADAWASRAPAFVGAGSCAACHAEQTTRWKAAAHAGVTCESCHGPLAGHPEATPAVAQTPSPGASAAPVPLIGIDERSSVGLPEAGAPAVCLSCHRAAVGRPSGFPTVDPDRHFAPATCVACHDPHVALAPHPPDVLHPLAGLPECTFCHGPTGLRPLPATHPTWSGDCLTCHKVVPSSGQP